MEREWIDRAENIQQRILQLRDSLDHAGKRDKAAAIERQMAAADFWNHQERAREVVAELKSLKAILKPLDEVAKAADDLATLVEMAAEDDDLAAEVPDELARLERTVEDLETKALLNGPLDANPALLTINARDGGTDANDWAEMLLRMYLNWAKEQGYDTELLDRQDNEEAGINSATIAIRGPMAYGYLKGESGIHRLVRISPFNAEGKRQTSFAAVDVAPEMSDQTDIEIRPEDIEEQVFRSSGPGGQHVNKTSSAVRLIHHPTGIAVACQSERSQHKNRATAMKMLRARLARIEEEKREAEQAAKYNQMPKVGFGSQIRSYFLHPDQRVKDSRTGYAETQFHNVLDGHIQGFLDAYLRYRADAS
ncbi:MAG: peptide chain release factor 2 [Planctomycetaceae bacterium]|nr:peptide chain release factor 2 [Planctomycetaceae bacterium]